jgi:hypothetical protein
MNGKPAPLPSGQAALDLVKGRPGGFGRTVACTFGRAALIGVGMLVGGKTENLARDAFAGALGIEAFVLAWAYYRSREAPAD